MQPQHATVACSLGMQYITLDALASILHPNLAIRDASNRQSPSQHSPSAAERIASTDQIPECANSSSNLGSWLQICSSWMLLVRPLVCLPCCSCAVTASISNDGLQAFSRQNSKFGICCMRRGPWHSCQPWHGCMHTNMH